ncbi:MAG TPA: serine/threonine-protein kinase [Verrucomicrobiae bacterium]|nr:serine/threonine-protein kinase [Verrucomicrobiae bacterium]
MPIAPTAGSGPAEGDASSTQTQAAARQPTDAPQKIGKYELRGELGRGSCGVVYKGFDPFVQRDVAIKVAEQDPAKFKDTSLAHASFFVEARAAGMLQHPHIVATYDAGAEGSLNYIVMEYIDGDTLLPLCRKKGPRAPVEQVIDIAFKCAKALDFAHSKGVLHKDIKPANIMLTKEGVPKIMDFSIAEISAAPSVLSGVVGSPMYMAPEQVRAGQLGPQTDLYALGAVIFHLLAGEAPFYAEEVQRLFVLIKSQPPPPLNVMRPELPHQICEIVERLLSKDPADRYQSGGELATALMRLNDKLKNADKQISRRENRDSLRRLNFFSTFGDEEIDEIIKAGSMMTYQAGQSIIEEDALENAFYLLVAGTAEVRKKGKALHTMNKGDAFGEVGFLTKAKRTASVIAQSSALALKINSSLMDQLSQDCQLKFYKVFTETLIYRLSMTSAKLSAKS